MLTHIALVQLAQRGESRRARAGLPMRCSLVCSILLALAVAGAGAPAFAAAVDGCFSRVYDGEHLRQHPGQKTTSATAFLAHDKLRLVLSAGGAKSYIFASCAWQAQAGRDVAGKPLLPAFHGKAGYDCIVTYSEESVEEGGYLIFAPASDSQSVTIYVDSPVAARAALNGKARATDLGREDRVFKLTRAPASACKGAGD